MKKRKAQFYLVTAIIIALVISGLAVVSNYLIVKKEPTTFYDLSSQIKTEGARVIDYKIYNQEDIATVGNVIGGESFTDLIAEYATEIESDMALSFIYGNEEGAQVISYKKESSGNIGLSLGEIDFKWSEDKLKKSDPISITGNTVTVKLLNNNYDFNLEKNQNFLFVIAKKEKEEIYIDKK